MPLRCLLFASDEATARPLWRVITELGMEGEHCRQAVDAVQKLSSQSFHIVIADWDDEPEASFLVKTARELKAAHRPLTLAIVRDDAAVALALKGGANSVLRKPIVAAQVKDTLSTARDLLRAKLEPAAPKAQAAAANAAPINVAAVKAIPVAPVPVPPIESAARVGGFLHPVPSVTGGQFETESENQPLIEPVLLASAAPAPKLEPIAGPVAPVEAEDEQDFQPPTPPRREPSPSTARAAFGGVRPLPPITLPAAPAQSKSDLLSYDQPVQKQEIPTEEKHYQAPPQVLPKTAHADSGEDLAFSEVEESQQAHEKSSFRFRKLAMVVVLALTAGAAYVKVPQPLWKQNVRMLTAYVAHSILDILHPKVATPHEAPATHENFGQAGDEYKLPAVETIPDATTDASQIHVLPVVDPTIKPANGSQAATPLTSTDNAGNNPAPAPADPAGQKPADTTVQSQGQVQSQGPVPAQGQVQSQGQVTGLVPVPAPSSQPDHGSSAQADPFTPPQNSSVHLTAPAQSGGGSTTPAPAAAPPQPSPVVPAYKSAPPSPSRPQASAVLNHAPAAGTSVHIPGSLKSQIASSSAPEASGNKPVEAALSAIGPVDVPEHIARSLLVQQVDPIYPEIARANRQQGIVILQVIIARDGSVEDAKFMQGSLVFAKATIDAVRQWRFKPYSFNGRPAPVRTTLTVSFKPTP